MFPSDCRFVQSVPLRAPCQQLAACGAFVALPDAASKTPCVLVYSRAELVAHGDEAIPVRLLGGHESVVTALAFSADNDEAGGDLVLCTCSRGALAIECRVACDCAALLMLTKFSFAQSRAHHLVLHGRGVE